MPKGVLFDTCGTRFPEGIWYMMKHICVAAFRQAKDEVRKLDLGDIVFFYHPGHGLVAAARVVSEQVHTAREQGYTDDDTLYRDVEFVTPIPKRGQEIRAMPYKMVCQIMGKKFFMAATIKQPYLTMAEADALAQRLGQYLKTG